MGGGQYNAHSAQGFGYDDSSEFGANPAMFGGGGGYYRPS